MIAWRVNMCILILFQNIHNVPLSEFLRYEISFYIWFLLCRGQAVFLSSWQFVTVWTIIIVQSSSITTDFWRHPSANTLARYKLDWDLLDRSWNWYNWTRSVWTPKYSQLSSWLKVAEFSWNWSRVETTFTWTPKTISAWIYKSTTLWDPKQDNWKQIMWQNSADNWNWWIFRVCNNTTRPYWSMFQNWQMPNDVVYKQWNYFDKWQNFVCIVNWNTTKFYINNVLVWTLNKAISVQRSLRMWLAPYDSWWDLTLYWYISNIIIENVARTDEDRNKYFNKMKSLYWVS